MKIVLIQTLLFGSFFKVKFIHKIFSIVLIAIILACSFIPIERKNQAYEPVFQQHYNEGDLTVSFLILQKASETIFQNSFYFVKKLVLDFEIFYTERKRFSLESLMDISSFLRNVFYTYTSIHAP